MKLNNENFDQSSFSHSRVVMSLLWLRRKNFTPPALRVSFRDMLMVWLEHNFSEKMTSIKLKLFKVMSRLKQGKV